jgi:hypothetical protein
MMAPQTSSDAQSGGDQGAAPSSLAGTISGLSVTITGQEILRRRLDYAGQAMHALISARTIDHKGNRDVPIDIDADDLSTEAFYVADAMLAVAFPPAAASDATAATPAGGSSSSSTSSSTSGSSGQPSAASSAAPSSNTGSTVATGAAQPNPTATASGQPGAPAASPSATAASSGAAVGDAG